MYRPHTRAARVSFSQNPRWMRTNVSPSHTRCTSLLQSKSRVDAYKCTALTHALHESPSVKIPGGCVQMYRPHTRAARVSFSQNPRWTCKYVPQSHTRCTSLSQNPRRTCKDVPQSHTRCTSLSQNPRWTYKDVPQSHTRCTSLPQSKCEVDM